MTDQTRACGQPNRLLVMLKRWGGLLLLGLLMATGFSQGWHNYFSLDELVKNRELLMSHVSEHFWLALSTYGLVYAVAVALSFPGASFLTIAGGLLFGWMIGGVLTVLAATLGAGLVFLAARSALGGALRASAGSFADRFTEGFRQDAFHYLLFLRLVPVFPFWLINIVPALFKVRLPVYLLATLIGILPGTFAFALVGSGLDSVIEAQIRHNPGCVTQPDCQLAIDTGSLITGELILAFVAMGVFALIPPILKAIRNSRKERESA
ncbi:TVP38/TMEM64 family protein [uncultured Cohaesibacter sp.]|uniref:TVP38/TMEM64 family protein n=1 Tax=uncultured Cohaesibacter sp. TaxID=1002546 RepID=UPI00292E2BE4|nr:TVP38/TMEM64 family protein [uncultured Cohaesibacter sp.]